jgi:hypothetical protein
MKENFMDPAILTATVLSGLAPYLVEKSKGKIAVEAVQEWLAAMKPSGGRKK